jgi:glycosyltransferase involved in cell wall biosynthesis
VRRAKRLAFRLLRLALVRVARARPRATDLEGAERRVTILMTAAWGMGGTIRANLNLARHLAATGHEVEIISIVRGHGRDEPFFGAFPEGVKVVSLDDRRRNGTPPGPAWLRKRLRARSSVLMNPADRTYKGFSLWVDLRLVRALRRRTGFLIATRPGLNLIAAELAPPGLVLIGEEQMNLAHHNRRLRREMPRLYPRLDALTVLTSRDREAYVAHVGAGTRIERIPNTARDMGSGRADLRAKAVLTAGRLATQKGYDMLIPAWAVVAERHPDWRLEIFGSGPLRKDLEALIASHGLGEAVTLKGPSSDLGAEMDRASIYVLSSRVEGLPLVMLEAMSKGMAVVSFDCPTGPADIIDDHRNGLLVPAKDSEGLGRALCEMIEDEALRRRCAEAAVETAREYSVESVMPIWDALLAELWAGRGNGASAGQALGSSAGVRGVLKGRH